MRLSTSLPRQNSPQLYAFGVGDLIGVLLRVNTSVYEMHSSRWPCKYAYGATFATAPPAPSGRWRWWRGDAAEKRCQRNNGAPTQPTGKLAAPINLTYWGAQELVRYTLYNVLMGVPNQAIPSATLTWQWLCKFERWSFILSVFHPGLIVHDIDIQMSIV